MPTVVLVAVTLAVLFLPGGLVAWALRVRGLLLVVLAPAVTFAIAGAAGQWLRIVGLPWNLWSAAAVFGIAAAAGWALSRWLRTGPDDVVAVPGRPPAWWLAGPAAGSALALAIVGNGIGWDLDAVNQSWDPPWHANLVTSIATTGIGDWTASVNNQLAWDGQFYPTGLHVVEALVVLATGQGAVRVFTLFLVLSAVLLPWGIALLARVAAPAQPLVAATAGAVAVSLPFQPWAQLGTQAWTWSMAAAPAAAAAAIVAARPAGLLPLPTAALALAGCLALQPAGLASCLVLLACWWAAGPVGLRHRMTAAARLAGIGLAAALLLLPELRAGASATASVATFFDQPPAPWWPVLRSALLLAVTTPDGWWAPSFVVVTAAGVGLLVALWRRDLRWLALAHVVTVALHVASRSAPVEVRPLLTGLWYSDSSRLARLESITAVLLAGVGVAGAVALASRVRWPAVRALLVAAVPAAVVAGLVVDHRPVRAGADMVLREYAEHPGGPSITDQQVEVLRTVAPLFDDDEHVVVDSWQGGIWMYALTGIRGVEGRYGDPDTYEADLLLRHVDEVDTNPDVREVLVEHKVCGVYVGTGSVVPRDWTWSGFDRLDEARAFEEVYSDEDSQVYVLTGPLAERAGCRSAQGPQPAIPPSISEAG